MPAHRYVCPECEERLEFGSPVPSGKSIRCPECAAVFRPRVKEATRRSRDAGERPRRRPARRPSGPNPAVLWGGVAAGVLLMVGLVIGGIFWMKSRPGPDPVAQNNPDDNKPAPGPGGDSGVKAPVFNLPALPVLNEPPHLVLDPGGHTAMVRAVLFTADGQYVISASFDKTVRVTAVATGETVRVLRLPVGPGDEGAIQAAALSADGKYLAVGGMSVGAGKNGDPIHVLSMETGQVARVLKGHKDAITGLSFARDGKHLASCSTDHTGLVYSMETGEVVAELKGHTERVQKIAFSPDGKKIATASSDSTARVWSFPPQGEPVVLRDHKGPVHALAWSPDSRAVATGGPDTIIRLWMTDGQLFKKHLAPADDAIQITTLNFTSDGGSLLYGGVGSLGTSLGRAGFIDVLSGVRRVVFKDHTNTVMSGALSPDGTLAVTTGGHEHEVFVWQTADGQAVRKLQGAGRSPWGVGWSADGKSVAWGNTNRGDPLQSMPPLERSFRLDDLDLDRAPPAPVVRGTLKSGGWELEPNSHVCDHFGVKKDGKGLYQWKPPRPERIYTLSVIPGDRGIVGGSSGLYLVDLANGRLARTFVGHSGFVVGVAPSPDGKHFVTCSTDQTVRVWSPERDSPVLSIFTAGQDWIAWTPEGYYAASAYGERLMGWQVNAGLEALAWYFPAAQFRPSLYAPGALKLLLSAGSLQAALGRAGQQPAATTVAQVLPPVVAIVSPAAAAGGVKLDQAKFEVKAAARSSGDHPVKGMRLLVDGRPYHGLQGIKTIPNPKLGTAEATWTVDLSPGKHTLMVQAESAVSKGLSPPVEVTTGTSAPKDPGALYILAIGISVYDGDLKLNYAASDARSLSFVLNRAQSNKGIYTKVESRLVTDKQATKAAILEGLDWMKSVMTQRDVGIVFFSGHGAREEDGTFYLIPVDVNARDVAGSCVNGEVVKAALANMPGRLIAMLDCCHSGTAAESFGNRNRADNLVRDLVSDEYGVIVMCASLGRECALESPLTKAGFFTRAAVDGLTGLADANKDRVIYIHELDYYIGLAVRQMSRGMQNPVTGKPPLIKSFPLSSW